MREKTSRFTFHVDGKTFSTWCAWDALFLPAMLNQHAQVESMCPVTKEKIRVIMTPAGIESCEPNGAVLSIIVPNLATTGSSQLHCSCPQALPLAGTLPAYWGATESISEPA